MHCRFKEESILSTCLCDIEVHGGLGMYLKYQLLVLEVFPALFTCYTHTLYACYTHALNTTSKPTARPTSKPPAMTTSKPLATTTSKHPATTATARSALATTPPRELVGQECDELPF